jgi:dipeptidase
MEPVKFPGHSVLVMRVILPVTLLAILLGPLSELSPAQPTQSKQTRAWFESLNVHSGCFSVVVGKKASLDGSVMFAHNEDAEAPAVNLYKVPRGAHNNGEQESLPYLWLNVTTCDMCATYVNESGVVIGSDACPSREDTPELTNGGILFWLRRLAIERAQTAREAVKIAGGLISELGYADGGRTYIIADPNEAWILAAVHGKHWAAARVPDDKVVVIPNCFTIQQVDLGDTLNFLGSADIIDYAGKRGWYDPARDGAFDFSRAYSPAGSLAHPANAGRMWRGIDLVTDKKFDIARQLPFAVAPVRKITVQDLMRTMQDRYDGTEIPEPEQAGICHAGTMYSMVAHLRSWLPAEIGPLLWVSFFHPDLQAYSAWYPGITAVPEGFAVGDHQLGLQEQLDRSIVGHKKERPPAYSAFAELDQKARMNAAVNAPHIKKVWRLHQDRLLREQAAFEKRVLSVKPYNATTTLQRITEQSAAGALSTVRKARALIKSLH